MSRIFITGSSDGLGLLAARLLIQDGHEVLLHGRNEARSAVAMRDAPGALGVVTGDLASFAETTHLAEAVNHRGPFDSVIHNAAIGYREPQRAATSDGLPALLAINTLAPYVLTALIQRPARLIYLSSGLHRGGDPSLNDLTWSKRPWNGMAAYSDSKLHMLILALAIARRWKDVHSNALEPGWVATKMGGPGAPDNLMAGAETQAWLASSGEAGALVTGQYFFHKEVHEFLPAAARHATQDLLLDECARLTGVSLAAR
jgi:NAD(P)-dependent dehydrogenase (short-subunit alcohol dehydrogenase family)